MCIYFLHFIILNISKENKPNAVPTITVNIVIIRKGREMVSPNNICSES